MRKTLDNWLDVVIMICLIAACITISVTAVNSVAGMQANIGKDKVNIAADHVVYEDVTYNVGDLLLSCIRHERLSPADIINVSYGDKSIKIEASSEVIIENPYEGSRMVMSLKPAGMTNEEFYALPTTTELVIDSSKSEYTYNVKIGG